MDSFLKRCFYEQGFYDTCTGMAKLNKRMKQLEGDRVGNRIFYLSVPPDVVVDVATCLAVTAPSPTGWTRVIVEKPFGMSGESSKAITQGLQEALSEEQIYR
jgi:glucose-6-phosphate 1-dehydrogenase